MHGLPSYSPTNDDSDVAPVLQTETAHNDFAGFDKALNDTDKLLSSYVILSATFSIATLISLQDNKATIDKLLTETKKEKKHKNKTKEKKSKEETVQKSEPNHERTTFDLDLDDDSEDKAGEQEPDTKPQDEDDDDELLAMVAGMGPKKESDTSVLGNFLLKHKQDEDSD